MAFEEVLCQRDLDQRAEVVWAHLRDFCAPWHPLIDTMTAEAGGQLRAFTVKGEDTVYREWLTWFSDTLREMRYVHLEGIDGAQRYAGCLLVEAVDTGCCVTMGAEIEAPEGRAQDIAEGTKAIFEIGLQALTDLTEDPQPEAVREESGGGRASTHILPGTPALALSATPKKDGPLCLFLHGIGGNRSNWADQLACAGRFTQAAALDLRGYGDSTLGAQQTTLEDYCADILHVCAHFDATRVILCGLSYGAWIATAFAERYPEKMAGLILSGGCTGMSEASPAEREAFRTSREVPLDAGQAPVDFAPAVVELIAGPHASQAARAQMLSSMAAIPAATYRDALRCFTNPPRTFDFSKLDMPVLMMTGQHDPLAPPDEIQSAAARIHAQTPHPDVRFEIIKGVGHLCNLEAPALYNGPMMDFLRRVAR